MKTLIVMLALLFGVALTGEASAAPTAVCRSAKPTKPKGVWSWRMIDGRKCWYQGKAGRAKTTLHWAKPQPVRRVQRVAPIAAPVPPPVEVEVAQADNPLLASVWPEALPPSQSFQDRWPDKSPPPLPLPLPPRHEFPTMAFAFASASAAEAAPAPIVRARPRTTNPSVVPALLLVLGPASLLFLWWMLQEWAAARRRRRTPALPYWGPA